MIHKARISRLWTLVLAAAATAWLAGCDGGNGGGPAATPTTTPLIATSTPTTVPTAIPTAVPPQQPGAGLQGAITNAVVDPTGHIVVTFTLTDDRGVPITALLSRAQSDNDARVRFTVAHVEEVPGGGEFASASFTRYVNDINVTRPTFDSDGMLETLDSSTGTYRYTFETALPEGFDPSQTYSVGMQIDRTFEGEELGVDPVFDFAPDGARVQIRAGSTTARCNQCHDPLILHGNRREFRLCTLCHTAQATDAMGTSINLGTMIHKIHRGKDLPSIVNGDPGATYAIFSNFAQRDVVFAQKDADGEITGVAFPRTLLACETCHAEGATAGQYLTKPSTATCAACHDDVNPSLEPTDAGPPGTNHFQSRGFAEGDCSFCHVPSGHEFDISVAGAHTIPERSAQLAGLNIDIVGMSSHGAGETPTIAFKVTDGDGNALTDLSGLDRVAFTFAGPTTDYSTLLRTTAIGGGAAGEVTGPDGAGVFQYIPDIQIPETAAGTWAAGAEARRAVEFEGEFGPVEAEEAAPNPVVTFSVDDSEALVRRMVVEDTKCQSCHGVFSRDFSIHGNLRNRVEYCVMCHNPDNSDIDRRRRDPEAVANGDQNEPIDFKHMIHKIHTGEELQNKPYLIYGFGPSPTNFSIVDFSDVRFPGDRRNCQKCHLAGTNLIPPFPGTALPTRLTSLDPGTGDAVDIGEIPPITSVCTACHDGDAAAAHAATQTAANGAEACAICHGEGRSEAISTVHAR